jgi:hypothetical protein
VIPCRGSLNGKDNKFSLFDFAPGSGVSNNDSCVEFPDLDNTAGSAILLLLLFNSFNPFFGAFLSRVVDDDAFIDDDLTEVASATDARADVGIMRLSSDLMRIKDVGVKCVALI